MDDYMTLENYKKPIITNNRNFRELIPAANKHFIEAEKEAKRFPTENGVIIDHSIVNYVAQCPICGSSHVEQLFLKWGFIYVKCFLCEHVFVKNRIRDDILLTMYSVSNLDKLDREVQKSSQHKEYWGKVYHKYLSLLSKCSINNKNLLDVGCGSGAFLKYCRNNTDYNLHGIDFADDTYDSMISLLGKENYYFKQKVETLNEGKKRFGVITFWGVLEHLVNPKEVFNKCFDILDDRGHMIVIFPNLYSRAFKILGIHVPTLNPREHIQFYTSKSFNYLCKETGFSVIGSFQELPIIDLMYEYIDYNNNLIDDILEKNESYYYVYLIKKEKNKC